MPLSIPLPRFVQHGIDRNSVSLARIAQKDMGHGTHQFTVLNDGTAAHE